MHGQVSREPKHCRSAIIDLKGQSFFVMLQDLYYLTINVLLKSETNGLGFQERHILQYERVFDFAHFHFTIFGTLSKIA